MFNCYDCSYFCQSLNSFFFYGERKQYYNGKLVAKLEIIHGYSTSSFEKQDYLIDIWLIETRSLDGKNKNSFINYKDFQII